MLIRITNKCLMGCSHCMVDATPSGEHMSMATFENTIDFIDRMGFRVAMLSGGEPTENPDVLNMIDLARYCKIHVILLSNGAFLDDPVLSGEILGRMVSIQVTNDPRFYPKRVNLVDNPNISYETHIRIVSPFGRAKSGGIECTRQSPLCFNLRSICRSLRDFRDAIFSLRTMGKFCTPSVNADGAIVAGETPSCSAIGTVRSPNIELTNAVCDLKCSRCGLVNNLDDCHRKAIGER